MYGTGECYLLQMPPRARSQTDLALNGVLVTEQLFEKAFSPNHDLGLQAETTLLEPEY